MVAVALPALVGGRHGYGLGTTAVIAVMLALGYQVIYGFSGQLSVAHAPLQGVGAYSAARLMTSGGWSWWAALVPAALAAAAVGAIVSLPGLRVRGDVLALATLGAGEILQSLFLHTTAFTGGYQGIAAIPAVSLAGHRLGEPGLYALAALMALVTLAAVRALRASPLGRAWLATRDNELAARSLGIHPGRLRLQAFAVGSGIAGAAGALYAVQNHFVSSVSFGLTQTVQTILIALLAGQARIGRTVAVAVAVTVAADRLTGHASISEGLTGVMILAVVAIRLGLAGAAAGWLRGLVRRAKRNRMAVPS